MLEPPTRYWSCPSCVAQHVSHEARPHLPMHPCPGQAGMMVPYVEAHPGRLQRRADRRHHRLIERGDYAGSEKGLRRTVDGRLVMAVHTERPDGSHDTCVFPAMATADPIPR